MQKFSIPVPKQVVVRDSCIDGAGKGLFLCEDAAENERVAIYTGKVLDAKQVAKSASEYVIQISKNVFLDAKKPEHQAARYINCARKAARTANVRFGAKTTVNYCKETGIAWISVFADKDIAASPESPVELLADYGDSFWDGSGVRLISTRTSGDDDQEDTITATRTGAVQSPAKPRRGAQQGRWTLRRAGLLGAGAKESRAHRRAPRARMRRQGSRRFHEERRYMQ